MTSVPIGCYLVRYDEASGALERQGTATPRGAKVVSHRDGLLAVKIPGSRYYGGQGAPFLYASAKWEVYEEVREEGDGWLLVRARLSWPVRA